MTNDDRVSALSLATEKQVRDPETRENVGGLMIKKTNGKGPYGAEIGDLLWANNGTFHWDMESPENGLDVHDSIYQAMAAAIRAPGAPRKERTRYGDMYESDARSGCQSLARWLDEQFGIPLYRCKTPGSKNQVTVITVHPDYVVNPDTGETAKESQRRRDKEALFGQARSTLKRMIRDEGETVRQQLGNELYRLTTDYDPPEPKRQ